MSRRIFLLLFIFVLILDLFQIYTDGAFRYLTKPLIMISLIMYYLGQYNSLGKGSTKLIFLIALFGALAGDIFLLFETKFMWGLASFLVMQILYSYVFWQDRNKGKLKIGYGIGLLIVISIVAFLLWDQLGNLKIPVLIYMGAIGLMSFTAHNRYQSLNGYYFIFIGTLLFIISDTVLGIHQFDTGIHLGKLTVMLTYASAQYLIVQGYLDSHTER